MDLKVTTTYLDALAHVTAKAGAHFFTCLDDVTKARARDQVARDVQRIHPGSVSDNIASTLAEWAMGSDCITSVTVDTEEHLGSIIVHYDSEGHPLRFLALGA